MSDEISILNLRSHFELVNRTEGLEADDMSPWRRTKSKLTVAPSAPSAEAAVPRAAAGCGTRVHGHLRLRAGVNMSPEVARAVVKQISANAGIPSDKLKIYRSMMWTAIVCSHNKRPASGGVLKVDCAIYNCVQRNAVRISGRAGITQHTVEADLIFESTPSSMPDSLLVDLDDF